MLHTAVRNYIEKNEIDKALDFLKRNAPPEYQDEISVFAGSYKRHKDEYRRHLIDRKELNFQMKALSTHILELVHEIEPTQGDETVVGDPVAEPEQPRGIHKWNYFAVAVVLLIIVVSGWFIIARQQAKCEAVKDSARETLNVIEERSRGADEYDTLKYIYWIEKLKHHIRYSECDSIESINRDVNYAKSYLLSE